MPAWSRIAVFLGLVDYEETPPSHPGDASAALSEHAQPDSSSGVVDPQVAAPRPTAGAISAGIQAGRSVTIRPAPPKPQSIAPQNKGDLRRAIDALRGGQSVIIDVSHVPTDLRYRMLDFLSGGCSAVGARMEKVAVGVFLLDPASLPSG